MNEHRSRLKLVYDKIWKIKLKKNNYNKTIEYRKKGRKVFYDIIQKYTMKIGAPSVMELGCGSGIDISIVKELNNNIKAFGSDVSEIGIQVSLRLSGKNKRKIFFFVSDTHALPLKTDGLDIVFSQGLVEHFKDPVAVIKEQMRVVRKGGILMVNVPQKFTGYTLEKRRLIKKNKWKLGWETAFSYKDLKNIGIQLGLKEVDIAGYQYWKSWKEPTFVFKDLIDKIFRRIPLYRFELFASIQKRYNTLWKKIERKWGHYFLQNIVIVFQK